MTERKGEIFHYKVLAEVRKKLYSSRDYFTTNDLVEKLVVKGNKYWLINRDRRKILFDAEGPSGQDNAKNLPFVAKVFEDVKWQRKVYDHILKIQPRRILPEKKLDFRQLVTDVCNFDHSEPIDYLLYKIVALASIIRRINCRISAPREFGKSSYFEVINHLFNNIGVLPPNSTLAKAEYSLYNKSLFWEEVSNQTPDQIRSIEQFLLVAGDGRNEYVKSSRGSAKFATQDVYDISNLSVVLVYNTYQEYQNAEIDGKDHSDKFFDKVMNPQTRSRFIPLAFSGKLGFSSFNVRILNPVRVAEDNFGFFQDIRRSVAYYAVPENFEKELVSKDWGYPKYDDIKGRWEGSLMEIFECIKMFSRDKEEYKMLCDHLHKCHQKYQTTIKGSSNLFEYEGVTTSVDKKVIEEKVFGQTEKKEPEQKPQAQTAEGYILSMVELGIGISELEKALSKFFPGIDLDKKLEELKAKGELMETNGKWKVLK